MCATLSAGRRLVHSIGEIARRCSAGVSACRLLETCCCGSGRNRRGIRRSGQDSCFVLAFSPLPSAFARSGFACFCGSICVEAHCWPPAPTRTPPLKSGETALMAASRAGSLDAVNALLAAGARVNTTESTRGQSALMWGVANRHPADHAGAHRARGGRRSPEQDPAPGRQRGRQPVRRLGVARHLARRSGRRRQHGATVRRAVG